MAIASTAFWRVRPSGSNTNGGGYDCGSSGGSITPAATGTAGSWATVSGTTTFTDTVAAAFTSGMVGRAINVVGIGQFSVLSYISATQITITTPRQSTSVFGANASWAVGPGTDYSQQNTAQASGTAGANTGAPTYPFTDATANSFTAAMVGNAIYITGGGSTTGWYFCTSYSSASTIGLDRSCGTTVSGATWALGGAWANFWTNPSGSSNPVTAGNTVYVLGTSIPNPASYTYDYDASSTYYSLPNGNNSAGFITYAADANSTSYGAGGFPVVKTPGLVWYGGNYSYVRGLYFVAASAAFASYGLFQVSYTTVENCVFDQFGYDVSLFNGNGAPFNVVGCEVFSSKTAATGSMYALNCAGGYNGSSVFLNNNVHDCVGKGVSINNGQAIGNIISNCASDGLSIGNPGYGNGSAINNTIDGNKGNGIVFTNQASVSQQNCINNIISNHTTSGKYGMVVSGGSASANTLCKALNDYNSFYNNTTHYSNIYPGRHDTVLTTNPYVGRSTENYTLA